MTDQDVSALLSELDAHPISFGKAADGGQKVFLGDCDVTLAIRQHDVTNNVSWVSALPEVREELVQRRRRIAEIGGIVMDGRDIGTVVLPNAELKIFLIASVEERALRRFKENQEKGIPTDLETLKEEIAARDFKDSNRKVSPLKNLLMMPSPLTRLEYRLMRSLPLFQKKQMKFLTSRKSLGILVTLRKAEVRASRLATSVVWPYMSTFL